MSTTETVAGIPEEVKAQLRQTLDDIVKGIRRPEKMNAACERMDRMREENRKLLGEQQAAVALSVKLAISHESSSPGCRYPDAVRDNARTPFSRALALFNRGSSSLQQLPRPRHHRQGQGDEEERGEHEAEGAHVALELGLAGGVGLQLTQEVEAAGDAAVPPRVRGGGDAVLAGDGGEGVDEDLNADGTESRRRRRPGTGRFFHEIQSAVFEVEVRRALQGAAGDQLAAEDVGLALEPA